MFLVAALFPAGLGVAQIAASAPPTSFCDRKPNHPKCVVTTATTTPPTTTTTVPPPTTTEPPPTTTAPTSTDKAHVWVSTQ